MGLKKISFFLILSFIIININAQNNESNRKFYDEKVLFRFGNTFKIGEEKFKFNQLQFEFKSPELGLINYRKAKNYRTISAILRSASMAALVGVINGISNNNRQQTLIFLGIQTGFAIGTGVYLNMSNQSVDKAIFHRNKDYLFPRL